VRTVKRLSSLLVSVALLAGGAISLAASPAGAATTVVTAGSIAPHGAWSLEPTSNTGSYSFVTGPATPPGGTGSLRLTIASGQHEWLNNYSYGACATGPACNNPNANRTLISTIDTLGYSTYRASGSTIPTFNIEIDPIGDGSGYTTLVFVPTSGLILDTVWQTWNGLNPVDGAWFSTRQLATGVFSCAPQSCSASWSQIQTDYPLARVKYGLGPNVGTGGTFSGNVDNLSVGVSGTTTVYDFENAPTAPVPVSAVPNGNNSAKVIWNTPSSNGGSPITGYYVQPYRAGVAKPVVTINSATPNYASITGLSNGVNYRFQIAARTAVGTGAWSPKTAVITVGAPGVPGTPTAVKVASGSLKNTFAAPSGNGAPISSFTVICTSSNGGATKSNVGPASPITVTGATAGKTYTCRVKATNSRGTGPLSKPSNAVIA
jgi:hypothetical protein